MPNSVDILLVEDNPGDIRLTQEAFREADFQCQLHIARDGEEALAFLHRHRPFESSPRPAFILLDLNLPRKDGREVLSEIKREKEFRQIPVFILSTSTGFDDISNAYDNHANCYIPKPVDVERLVQVSRDLKAFWLGSAVLPAA